MNCIRWNDHDVYYRPGTSDPHVLNSIILKGGRKAEYWIPKPIRPRTVFDIGGNIGAAALYFARTFPEARIFSFEPVPANFEVLTRNIAPYPNIQAFNVALGAQDGKLELIESPNSDNFGGFSQYQRGADASCGRIQVACRSFSSMLNELGLEAPDLIKVDTEGAEFVILTALPTEVLAKVSWIAGELHGENDFELLAYLSQWFEIGIRKSVNGPLCNFHARNRQLVKV
ncbi:MAG: FkbM family methyltransferase [Rhodocyclales bacterium]|nr:FkbM family methyltransferase [Rhodocyclales bacterium]